MGCQSCCVLRRVQINTVGMCGWIGVHAHAHALSLPHTHTNTNRGGGGVYLIFFFLLTPLISTAQRCRSAPHFPLGCRPAGLLISADTSCDWLCCLFNPCLCLPPRRGSESVHHLSWDVFCYCGCVFFSKNLGKLSHSSSFFSLPPPTSSSPIPPSSYFSFGTRASAARFFFLNLIFLFFYLFFYHDSFCSFENTSEGNR